MLSLVTKYAHNFYASQNGEEGVLIECQRRGIGIFHCVEIGGNNGLYCSNTAYVIETDVGVATGLFVEADYNLYQQSVANWKHNPLVRHQCCRVTAANVNAFVHEDCDLLSIDTDGSDYEIFCALKHRPKIVIVEIDSSIEPPRDEFNSDGGASYWKMVVAGLERGYFLIAHTGNLIFVRQEYQHLFPECAPHPLIEWEKYFNRGWVKEAVL